MPGTIAFVQARMGSARLSGKVMADIGGRPMLYWVLARLAKARCLDRIVVVTTCLPADDILCGWLSQGRWAYYRGSELDLLDRYYQASLVAGAEIVVRITSDCPLIDPALVDEVVQLREREDADYAYNFAQRFLPLGLSAEACTMAALERAWRDSTEPHERTHATPYLYLHPDRFRIRSVAGGVQNLGHLRWTVDTPEDLQMLRALHDIAGDELLSMNWRQVLALVQRHESIGRINENVHQKTLQEL